jgi:hypothetical protein
MEVVELSQKEISALGSLTDDLEKISFEHG